MVKIWGKELEVYVNGKNFDFGLDDNIENSEMAEQFGKVVTVVVRGDYFELKGYTWNTCAIEKIITRETYPEYFL